MSVHSRERSHLLLDSGFIQHFLSIKYPAAHLPGPSCSKKNESVENQKTLAVQVAGGAKSLWVCI